MAAELEKLRHAVRAMNGKGMFEIRPYAENARDALLAVIERFERRLDDLEARLDFHDQK